MDGSSAFSNKLPRVVTIYAYMTTRPKIHAICENHIRLKVKFNKAENLKRKIAEITI